MKPKFIAALLALLAVTFATPPPALAASVDSHKTIVAATSTNTVVTPLPVNTGAKVGYVRVYNDGPGAIYVDFDKVAVAGSTTAEKIGACEGREFALDGDPVTTLGVITDAGVTSAARVYVDYLPLRAVVNYVSPRRITPISNADGCKAWPFITARGFAARPFVVEEEITLSLAAAFTDSTADMLPANSIIMGVGCRVTVTILTATNWAVGDPTTAARFAVANATLTAGTTTPGLSALFGVVTTTATGPTQAAVAKLRITTTGSQTTAGKVYCVTWGWTITPPTS